MTRELLRAPRDYTSREKRRVLAVVIKAVNLRDGYPEFGELTWPAKHTDLDLDHRKFPEREIRKRKGELSGDCSTQGSVPDCAIYVRSSHGKS